MEILEVSGCLLHKYQGLPCALGLGQSKVSPPFLWLSVCSVQLAEKWILFCTTPLQVMDRNLPRSQEFSLGVMIRNRDSIIHVSFTCSKYFCCLVVTTSVGQDWYCPDENGNCWFAFGDIKGFKEIFSFSSRALILHRHCLSMTYLYLIFYSTG